MRYFVHTDIVYIAFHKQRWNTKLFIPKPICLALPKSQKGVVKIPVQEDVFTHEIIHAYRISLSLSLFLVVKLHPS